MPNEMENTELLKRAGRVINSIVKGLAEVDLENRQKIMELCGEACAVAGSLELAKDIAKKATGEEELLAMINEQIPWCGTWTREGNTIQSVCVECGCPLVRNGAISLSGTFCYCSRGWVKTIFETLLDKSIVVELEKSIGAGDEICKFVVYTPEER